MSRKLLLGLLLLIPVWYFAIRPAARGALDVLDATPTPTAQPPARADAVAVDPRRLAAEPGAFVGQNVWLYGRALNVEQRDDYTWLQIMAQVADRTVTEFVVVEVSPKNTTILKDECYRVYGVGAGTQDVTRTLTGASGKAPLVRAYAVEPVARTVSGCAAP